MRGLAIGIAAMVVSGAAVAAAPPRAIGDEHRLSEAEVQKVLNAAALKREALPAPAPQIETAKPPARPIEGEVGVSIGSGGFREVFGTAVVPVGADGVAIVTIDAGEARREFRRRR